MTATGEFDVGGEPGETLSRPTPSGARSGALLAGASGVSIVAAYVFLFVAGRILGSDDYGSLAALLGVLAVVVIPAGALQMAVSREVARRTASGDSLGAAALARGAMQIAAVGTVPLLALALALSVPLSRLLHIDSVALVVLALLALSTALVFPVAMGVLQGEQSFQALAVLYVFPWLLRLVFLGAATGVGYRLGGAIFAAVAGTIGGTVLALVLTRSAMREPARLPRRELHDFLRYLRPVAAGLVGIALLTHVDILIVKARFSADTAGAYAAASAFARVGFFLPATILAVLFPRTAARQARGQETEDILGRSLLATALFCGLLALVYAAAGVGLVSTTFGPDFASGGAVLGPFGLAVGLFSLANVLVGYHLSRGEGRYAWIVGIGVLVQMSALATIPSSLRGVVWTNVCVGAGLLAAHELFVGSSVPALRAGLRRLSGVRTRLQGRASEVLLVLVGTTAVVCMFMWPVVIHLGSTIIGSPGSDSTGSVAFLWTLQHESGYHILGTMHHTLSGAPFGWDEGNGLNIQWFLPYYPAYIATKLFGAVAAYNLTTLAGYALSSASMYALVRYLGCTRLVAVWAGLVFLIFPWHLARAEHASLTHLEVLVLLLLALVAVVRRPTPVRFALVGVATLACWLTSGYFGGMAVVTAIAFSLGAALARKRGRLVLAIGSIGAALTASALVAIAAYASGTNAGAGINRAAGDLTYYGLRPLELVVPSARHLVFGDGLDGFWLRHGHGSNTTEISNYLGLLTLALAAIWIITLVRKRSRTGKSGTAETVALLTTFVVGLLFSLPSPVGGVTMPSKLLWEILPGFRVPSRWDPLLMAALVPLAALGLQTVCNTVARRRAAAIAVVAAAAVISFVELTVRPVHHFRTVPVPGEYTALKATAQKGIVAEYPLGYSDIYRLWQRVHGRPLVNGAPPATTADDARLVLLDPRDAGTAPSLSLLGVSAIVIHPGGGADVPVEPREPGPNDGYRLLGRFRDGAELWKVVAPPAPAFVTLPGGFAPPARAGASMGHALISSAGVGVIHIFARKAGVVQLVFEAQSRAAAATLRLADATRERAFALSGRTHIAADVRIPRGVSQLLVKVDPAPQSAADAVLLSTPHVALAHRRPVLSAVSLSPKPGF
jgi:O-antigen/teichoic acid export membrane protein